ncbi:MAG: pyridoxamine 5'-phosphate oxidase family protein, partial [Pseudomonadota bacterium]
MTDKVSHQIASLSELEALYGTPGRASLDKVATRLTPLYRRWIEASRFCILSTIGPEGTDASPRGD